MSVCVCYWILKNGWAKGCWVPITSHLSIFCYEVQITRDWMHLRESVTVVLLRDWSRCCCVIARDPVSFCPAQPVCFLLGPGTWAPSPRPQEAASCLFRISSGFAPFPGNPLPLLFNTSLNSPQEYLEWSKYIKPHIQPVHWFQLTSEFVKTERYAVYSCLNVLFLVMLFVMMPEFLECLWKNQTRLTSFWPEAPFPSWNQAEFFNCLLSYLDGLFLF